MSKLTKCKVCGAEISSNAKVCPQCGAKRKKHTALIIILVILGVLLFISAIASGSDEKPTKETGNAIEPKEKTEELFGVGDTAVFGRIKVTANEIKTAYGDDFFTPQNGNIYVGVNFTIENTSDTDVSISSLLLFDAYVDDSKCEYSFSAMSAFDASNNTLDGKLAPGKKMTGWYCVEIPENWTELELQVLQNWLSSSDSSAKFVFTK